MFPRALFGLLALTVAGSALADARQDLRTAYEHNLKMKSYRATMLDLTSNRQMSVVEFQAPDRYRVTAPGRPPSLMIGDSMYLDMHGKFMKVPMPKQMLGQYRNEKAMKELEKGAPVEALGPGLVGNEAARKYRVRSAAGQPDSTSTVWIGVRSGNVLQVETSGKNTGRPFAMRVLYSDFDSPSIRIDTPR